MEHLIAVLKIFCTASGLDLNWGKLRAYWASHDGTRRKRPWCDDLPVAWAEENELSKLLGVVFGMDLTSSDANAFLQLRIDRAMIHWRTAKMNACGRAVIINGILLSGLWFFLSIWGGTKAGIAKIRGQLFSFMWSGDVKRGRNRVNWISCCQPRAEGGLNLINPEDAVTALMIKWIVKACEPLTSNFHRMLRFCMSSFQPYQTTSAGGGPLAWSSSPSYPPGSPWIKSLESSNCRLGSDAAGGLHYSATVF